MLETDIITGIAESPIVGTALSSDISKLSKLMLFID